HRNTTALPHFLNERVAVDGSGEGAASAHVVKRRLVVREAEVEHGEVRGLEKLLGVGRVVQDRLQFRRGNARGIDLVVLVKREGGAHVFDDGRHDALDVTRAAQIDRKSTRLNSSHVK